MRCETVRLIKKRILGKGHQMTRVLQPQRERGREERRERERQIENERGGWIRSRTSPAPSSTQQKNDGMMHDRALCRPPLSPVRAMTTPQRWMIRPTDDAPDDCCLLPLGLAHRRPTPSGNLACGFGRSWCANVRRCRIHPSRRNPRPPFHCSLAMRAQNYCN